MNTRRAVVYKTVIVLACFGGLVRSESGSLQVLDEARTAAIEACKISKSSPGDEVAQARCGFAVWFVEFKRRSVGASLGERDWKIKKSEIVNELPPDVLYTSGRTGNGAPVPVIELLVDKAPPIRFQKGTTTPLLKTEAETAAREYKKVLEAVTDEARRHNVLGVMTLVARGYASSEGPEALNMQLSIKRAKYLESVLEPLYDRTVFRGIRAEGLGESEPTRCHEPNCTPANGCDCGGRCESFESGYKEFNKACEDKVLARRTAPAISF